MAIEPRSSREFVVTQESMEEREEVRKEVTMLCHIVHDLISHDNQVGFYFKCFEKPLKCLAMILVII